MLREDLMYRYLDPLVALQEELRGLLQDDLDITQLMVQTVCIQNQKYNPNQNQFERFMVSVIFM
jgi:hypothetical protein